MNNSLDFIKKDSKLTEAGFTENDIGASVVYSQVLLNYILYELDDAEDLFCERLHSKEIDKMLKEEIENLKISLKHIFIIVCLLLGSAEKTKDWFKKIYDIKNEITYEVLWLKVLSNPVAIERILFDMLKEIVELKENIDCFQNLNAEKEFEMDAIKMSQKLYEALIEFFDLENTDENSEIVVDKDKAIEFYNFLQHEKGFNKEELLKYVEYFLNEDIKNVADTIEPVDKWNDATVAGMIIYIVLALFSNDDENLEPRDTDEN